MMVRIKNIIGLAAIGLLVGVATIVVNLRIKKNRVFGSG